ncbi:MAG TPA: metalloregulator ArsR/SmtB family transcription factor [Anaerolineales bacterium]
MKFVPTLVALADATRCRIIEILRDGPQPVHALAAEFAISRPAISRHLRVLKQARIISENKIGRENLYSLHPDRLEPVQAWLAAINTLPNAPPTPIAAIASSTVETPEPSPAVAAVAAPKPRKPAPAKPAAAKPAPVSQMGFDF